MFTAIREDQKQILTGYPKHDHFTQDFINCCSNSHLLCVNTLVLSPQIKNSLKRGSDVFNNSQKSLFFNLKFIRKNQLCKQTILVNFVWKWDICFYKTPLTSSQKHGSIQFNWSELLFIRKRQVGSVIGYNQHRVNVN